MRNRMVIAALLFLLFSVLAGAQEDTRSLLFSPGGNYTRAQAGYRLVTEDDAFLPAEGKGLGQGEFQARARHWLDSLHRAEGAVSYERGVKRAVNWNTSSDWELLSPYVTIDTVGGDLQKEQYKFYARYAGRKDSFLYGGAINYRALHEFRAVDPRPRNVTADLEASAQAGLMLGRSALTLEAAYRKYHQNDDVSFLGARGYNTAIIHYLGLGSDYARFTGSSASNGVRFRGNGFSALLRLEPAGRQGWTAGLSYSYLDIVRQIKGQNEAPITSLLRQELKAYGGYLWPKATLQAQVAYKLNQGTENVLDQTGAFLSLAELTLYREPAVEAKLQACFLKEDVSGIWSLSPAIGFVHIEGERLFPSRSLSLDYGTAAVKGTFERSKGSWDFTAEASLGAHVTFSSALEMPLETLDAKFRDYYTHLYGRFSDTAFSGAALCTVGWKVRKDLRLYLQPRAGYTYYCTNHYRLEVLASLGIDF